MGFSVARRARFTPHVTQWLSEIIALLLPQYLRFPATIPGDDRPTKLPRACKQAKWAYASTRANAPGFKKGSQQAIALAERNREPTNNSSSSSSQATNFPTFTDERVSTHAPSSCLPTPQTQVPSPMQVETTLETVVTSEPPLGFAELHSNFQTV